MSKLEFPKLLVESESILVVNKPWNWKVEMQVKEKTLTSWLFSKHKEFHIDPQMFQENPAISGDTTFGPLCHRLDLGTSGPIIVGKTKLARENIRKQFAFRIPVSGIPVSQGF